MHSLFSFDARFFCLRIKFKGRVFASSCHLRQILNVFMTRSLIPEASMGRSYSRKGFCDGPNEVTRFDSLGFVFFNSFQVRVRDNFPQLFCRHTTF
jgi:hypothetical protein